MAGTIHLKAATTEKPKTSYSYQDDDDLGIGQVTRTLDIEHSLAVTCDLIWRNEWTIAAAGSENMDTDALAGDWGGTAISINFTTIFAVGIQIEPLTSTIDNDMVLSVTGGVDGEFPLVGSTMPILGDGLLLMGSEDGWTCGTTLVLVITNSGDANRTVRAMIAGNL